jgi:hypothetical protein
MKYKIVAIAALFIASLLGLHRPASAQTAAHQHDQDKELRSGQVRPRIGVMTEVVARQKLVTYGVKDVEELKLVGDKYVIKANYNNRPVELDMNAQSGLLTEKGSVLPLPVAASARSRVIKDRHIKVQRRELVSPNRVRPNRRSNR